MPHQCVKCGTLHENASDVLIKGCSNCKSRMFFFVKDSDLKKAEARAKALTCEEKEDMEKDVYEIMGINPKEDEPVVLDFESINIIEPGKYELDLVNLFQKDKPLIYKVDDGKYMIDLEETFNKMTPAKKKIDGRKNRLLKKKAITKEKNKKEKEPSRQKESKDLD